MIDLEYVKSNLEKYKENLRNRQFILEDVNLQALLKLYEERKALLKKAQDLSRQRNLLTGKVGEEEKARNLRKELQDAEIQVRDIEKEFGTKALSLPNMVSPNAPIGKDENDNVVVREVGDKPSFNFSVKDYLTLAKGSIEVERAAGVAGVRFGYLLGDVVLLEFALVKFAFDTLIPKGFIPVIPPVMAKPEIMKEMGKTKFLEGDAFYLEQDKLYLVGSSEHTIGPFHRGQIFEEADLPKRYVGFSSCFRREAGSYGKDTKGILRVHQFDKVEMFSFAKPDDSEKEHQVLLSCQEELMQGLKLPYRVMHICTGDMGFCDYEQYDIETWLPGQGKYRETHSCSNTSDFQARGIRTKYRSEETGKTRYVHTLNGTAFAIGRMIIAILENYQQSDGSVLIPSVLQSFMGKERLSLS